jgi:hypothetical protein
LGIVSIYIGQIYEEVKGRPNFIVRQTLGLGAPVPGSDPAAMDSNGQSNESRPVTQQGMRRVTSGSEQAEAPLNVSTSDSSIDDLVVGTLPEQHS